MLFNQQRRINKTSHFCVLVFCKEPDDVDSLLAPFQEYDYSYDYPKDYLIFKEDVDCEINPDTGKRGYFTNPYSLWDWYEIGGGYRNCFRLKTGETASIAKVSQYCFEPTSEEKTEFKREWEISVEGSEITEEEKEKHYMKYNPKYYTSHWDSKADYLFEMYNSWGCAFIEPNGKLHQKGEFLMFGCMDSTKETHKQYVEDWINYLKIVPDDYYMVVVDCHI